MQYTVAGLIVILKLPSAVSCKEEIYQMAIPSEIKKASTQNLNNWVY